VCERRYVFNAHLLDPSQLFDSTGACPEYEIPEQLAVAARAKKTSDDREFAVLSNLLPAAPIVTGRDGGGSNQSVANGAPRSAPASGNSGFVATSSSPERDVVTGTTTAKAAPPSVPTPQSNPRKSDEGSMAASLSGSTRGRTVPVGGPAPAQPEPAPAAQPAQQSTPPAPLPGATPIRSSGGFSFR
jgi:hypothetical protein